MPQKNKLKEMTLVDWQMIVIAITSLIVVFGFKKLNSAFIVFRGALLGFGLTFIYVFKKNQTNLYHFI